jgi:hypothetical protein
MIGLGKQAPYTRIEQFLSNPNITNNQFYKNDLVKDLKACNRKKMTGPVVEFEKNLLRDGVVIRANGYIYTDKGRVVDAELLDEEDPIRKKLEKRQKIRKMELSVKQNQPPLMVQEAIKST